MDPDFLFYVCTECVCTHRGWGKAMVLLSQYPAWPLPSDPNPLLSPVSTSMHINPPSAHTPVLSTHPETLGERGGESRKWGQSNPSLTLTVPDTFKHGFTDAGVNTFYVNISVM